MGTESDRAEHDSRFAVLQTSDGLEVRVRLGTSDDEGLLLDGFEQLSDQSRYQRFFTAMPELHPSTIDRLLDVGTDHVVLVALVRDDGGDGWIPAGGVRAIGLTDEPGTAELAITVIDAYQGRGLGTLLTAAVAAVASERGFSTLVAEVLATNEAMLGVLRSFDAELQRRADDGTVITGRLDTAVAATRLSDSQRHDLVAAERHHEN